MVTYRFRRYLPTLNGTQVTFSLPLVAEWETISIAADWKDGLKNLKMVKSLTTQAT
jgi:hypothetical protein